MKKFNTLKIEGITWDLNYRFNENKDKVIYFWSMYDRQDDDELGFSGYGSTKKSIVKINDNKFKAKTPGLRTILVSLENEE